MSAPVNRANVIAMLLLAAIGLGVVWWWQAGDRIALEQQARIWASGTPAPDAKVSSDESFETADSWLFLFRTYHYQLRATYQTPQGAREETLAFSSVLRSIDARAPGQLRYDPARPELFAVSWTVDRLSTGWAFLFFKWFCGSRWTTMCLWVVSLEYFPRLAEAPAADDPASPPSPVTVFFTRVVLLLVAGLVGMIVYALADDVWRRWDSYLQTLLALVLAVVVLAAIGWLVEAVRRGRSKG